MQETFGLRQGVMLGRHPGDAVHNCRYALAAATRDRALCVRDADCYGGALQLVSRCHGAASGIVRYEFVQARCTSGNDNIEGSCADVRAAASGTDGVSAVREHTGARYRCRPWVLQTRGVHSGSDGCGFCRRRDEPELGSVAG